MFFFFNDTATTEIYTLSLHDALPISAKNADERLAHRRLTVLELAERLGNVAEACRRGGIDRASFYDWKRWVQLEGRSEEHTSELQSRQYLVCRLLLEKKKTTNTYPAY